MQDQPQDGICNPVLQVQSKLKQGMNMWTGLQTQSSAGPFRHLHEGQFLNNYLMKNYTRKCDFHFSNDSLRDFVNAVKKLCPKKDLVFKATMFVYNFSSDIPKLLEEPYSKVRKEFDRYEDFVSNYYSQRYKSAIVEIKLSQLFSAELNLYNIYPTSSWTSIEISSADDNSANILLSFICDEQKKYPIKKISGVSASVETSDFVNHQTMKKLKNLEQEKINLQRLVQFCEEINHNWRYQNYSSVGLLSRAIIHHVPPLFGHKSFTEFVNNYKFNSSLTHNLNSSLTHNHSSKKRLMENLLNSQKHVSDIINHEMVAETNVTINEQMVDCRREIEVLLQEIILAAGRDL